MTPYESRSGKESGVLAYKVGHDYIIVEFASHTYKYTYKSCGQSMVELMKTLAQASKGLSSFISRQHPAYEQKK